MNTMSDAGDAAETFDVDVQQVTGRRPFIPLHRHRRRRGLPIQA
jgi:hypothetical protein